VGGWQVDPHAKFARRAYFFVFDLEVLSIDNTITEFNLFLLAASSDWVKFYRLEVHDAKMFLVLIE
jgi:hypothetical protein